MRDSLPSSPWIRESGIINLDDSTSDGTHWVAYNKNGKSIHYFDSFGNLQPPKEVVKYLGKNINYNYVREQKQFNTFNCGHLSLHFLLTFESAENMK